MEILVNFIIISAMFTFISEFATTSTYGWLMKNDDVLAYLNRYEKYSINSFDTSIISGEIDWKDTKKAIEKIKEGDFIAHTRLSLLSKYYISGKGRVFRWSSATNKIDNLYKISKVK